MDKQLEEWVKQKVENYKRAPLETLFDLFESANLGFNHNIQKSNSIDIKF